MKIIQMPDLLANKIAAGEVVERPASVVKELVENSIDANSTWIKIELEEAGLSYIKVADNGNGMSQEDCEIAFLRHATSKIRDENDLVHVKTLGFRGEALASIASVSRLKIKTSMGDQAGTLMELEGGNLVNKTKSDARQGTEIAVSDLFFNTPARLKYMKTIHTELGHITDLLNRLALAHPDVRFEVTHQDKVLFKSPGSGQLLQVISQIYGVHVARNMVAIKNENLDFTIEGYIAKPEITRASRSYISTIINGRYIKSVPLTQAIMRAYHTLLPIKRCPIVVLSIKMDPILVDVNVHPTKLEVRFSKEKELFQLIESTIKNKFKEMTLIPEMEQKENPSPLSQQKSMYFESSPSQNKQPLFNDYVLQEDVADLFGDKKGSLFKNQSSSNKVESVPSDDDMEDMPVTPKTHDRVPPMYPIGQLHGTYIMAQNETGLYMIDQHAAQERIKYEFYKEKLGKTINQSQDLLIPLTFEFSKEETIFIQHHMDKLEQAGLFLQQFGEQTYIVRSYPTWFPEGLEEEIIRDMVEQIIKSEEINIESLREEAATMMSCKRSIKANHYLDHDDMFQLLESLRKTSDPFTCPHGRPVIIHFTSYELEKMFKRVM